LISARDVFLSVRGYYEQKMPLLTKLEYLICFVLQIFRAGGAASCNLNASQTAIVTINQARVSTFGIIRFFYGYPPIRRWVYPDALGAFHLLLEGEGRDERAG
jgi:hypothetical protein